MTEHSDELSTMRESIQEVELQLKEMKKEYHNKRNEGLAFAVEARKEADAALQEELRKLGYSIEASKFFGKHGNLFLQSKVGW